MTEDNSTRKLTGDENIIGLQNGKVLDFWSWAYSNLLVNTIRPIFAEYVIAAALGIAEKPRVEWEGFDLKYRGKCIEVKASSYLQGWYQTQPSKIVFDIAKRKQIWDSETNSTKELEPPARFANCYVFSLYACPDKHEANILNLSHWEFYVVSTLLLDKACGDQKTVGLTRIQQLTAPTKYDDLKGEIDKTLVIT